MNRAYNPLGVPAHQHPNGGGWVADTAIVLDEVYVGPTARVFGGAVFGTIYGGTIRGGTIRGGTIYGGVIRGGTIYGGTIYGGTIRGGTLRGGTIRGGDIRGGVIRGGTIRGGNIRGGVIRGGDIYGGYVHGGVIHGGLIYGGYIYGGVIYGGDIRDGDIHGGVIRDARDVLTVGPIGSENRILTLTRSETGHHVSIGCWWEPAATIDDIAAEVQERAPEFAAEYDELMPMLRRRVDEWDAGVTS